MRERRARLSDLAAGQVGDAVGKGHGWGRKDVTLTGTQGWGNWFSLSLEFASARGNTKDGLIRFPGLRAQVSAKVSSRVD